MTKESNILRLAKAAANSAKTWADLSNALYDPEEGIVTKAYPNAAARAAFAKTAEHLKIRQLLCDAMNKSGVVEGATPQKSGRFVIRLPRSLHAALEKEASREGVSLNQLAVAKLAISLHESAFGKTG